MISLASCGKPLRKDVIPSVTWAFGPPMEMNVPEVGVAQTPGLGLRFVLHEPRTENTVRATRIATTFDGARKLAL